MRNSYARPELLDAIPGFRQSGASAARWLLAAVGCLLLVARAEAQFPRVKLNEIEQAIEEIRGWGDAPLADELQQELDGLRAQLDDPEFPHPSSDVPQRFGISLAQAAPAPPGVLQGTDRFKFGYSEVRVTYRARPVILELSGQAPIYWQVDVAEGARLAAIALEGTAQQEFLGAAPEGVPIVRRLDDARFVLNHWRRKFPPDAPWKTSPPPRGPLEHASVRANSRPDGKPIVVGPEDGRWREASVALAIDDLHTRALAPRRRRESADQDVAQAQLRERLRDARFRAIVFGHSGMNLEYALADYTLDGPIISTIRRAPVSFSALCAPAVDSKTGDEYIIGRGEVMVRKAGQPHFSPIDLGEGAPKDMRLTHLALDTKRGRLWLIRSDERASEQYLFDLAAQKLTKPTAKLFPPDFDSRRYPMPFKVLAVTYAPDADCFYAVTLPSYLAPKKNTTQLWQIDADGKVAAAFVHPDRIVAQPGIQTLGMELHPFGEYLVLLGHTPLWSDRQHGNLCLFDPKSGEVVYTGQTRPHEGHPTPSPPEPEISAALADHLWYPRDVLGTLSTDLARLEQLVEALDAAGRHAEAQRWQERFESLVALGRGDAVVPGDQSQLHVVACPQADEVVLQVTAEAAPAALVLYSTRATRWKLDLAPDATVRKIVLAGNSEQQVTGYADGTFVTIDSQFAIERDPFRGMQALRLYVPELAEYPLASFGWHARPGEQKIVLGPADADWQLQRLITAVEQALLEAPTIDAGVPPALRGLRFEGLVCGQHDQHPLAHDRRAPVDLAEYTIAGPIGFSFRPLPDGVTRWAIDPRGPTWYATIERDLVAIDPQTLEIEPIGMPAGKNWEARAIAFDTRRNRLVVSSSQDAEFWAYSPDKPEDKAWTMLTKRGPRASALAYAADEDVFYVVESDVPGFGPDVSGFARCTPEGFLFDRVRLDRPLRVLGQQHHPFASAQMQLHVTGEFLLLVAPSKPTPQDRTGAPTICVLAREGGGLVYEGQLTTQLGRLKLTDAEIEQLWKELPQAEGRDVARLVWRLAAGGQPVAQRLDKLSEFGSAFQQRFAVEILERMSSAEAKALLARWAEDERSRIRADAATNALRRWKAQDEFTTDAEP